MPSLDNQALFGAAGCGCHQQLLSPYALPDGTEPLIVSDFKNGIYMVGSEIVTVEDIWTEDDELGPYSPETDIVVDVGLIDDDGGNSLPVMLAELASPLLSNCTMVIQTAWASGATVGEVRAHHVELPGFIEDLELIYRYNEIFDPPKFIGILQSFEYGGPIEVPQTLTPNRIAITIINDNMAASVNGEAVLSFPLVKTAEPNTIYIELSDHLIIEYIAFYPPQDDEDLPALSELG